MSEHVIEKGPIEAALKIATAGLDQLPEEAAIHLTVKINARDDEAVARAVINAFGGPDAFEWHVSDGGAYAWGYLKGTDRYVRSGVSVEVDVPTGNPEEKVEPKAPFIEALKSEAANKKIVEEYIPHTADEAAGDPLEALGEERAV